MSRNRGKVNLRAYKIAFLSALLSALCGCSPRVVTQEVPVVVEHTSVQHRTDIVRDTLVMRDSVYHYVQGDTVRIERWHHVVDVSKMIVTDTIRDTVPRVVTQRVTELREVNVMYWWQTALMWLGGVLLGCGLIFIGFKTLRK